MKKLLYIGHEFHQKTKSTEFLIQLLEPHYEVQQVYLSPDASRAELSLPEFAGARFDVVVCLQILPPIQALDRILCDHVVFFPMFDTSGRWGIEQWLPYRRLRIFSFSSDLARRLLRWGFDAHYFQFFPDPGQAPPAGNPAKAFFWNRTEKINLPMVARLLSGSAIRDLHLHKVLDPGQRFLPLQPADADRFRIDESTWFETRALMQAKIAECGIYFAPRLLEGIGMSFLEAMALGRCVIAPDRPTMNEYITHGQTGFLYDPKRPAPLPLADIARIQQATRDYMVDGFRRWQRERERIVPLLEAPAQPASIKPWLQLLAHCALHPLRATRSPRQWLFSLRLRRDEWRLRICGFSWGGRKPMP